MIELSCVEVNELIKTPFFRRGKIGAALDVVVMVQGLLAQGLCIFTYS